MKTNSIITLVIIVLILIAGALYLNSNNDSSQDKQESKTTSSVQPSANSQIEPPEIPEMQEETPETESSTTHNLLIESFSFKEKTITIKQGDKIIWTNKDTAKHTVTSINGNELNSELFGKEQTYEHTFNEKGTYDYLCTPHPSMKGKVIVE